MLINAQHITYHTPNRGLLFNDISFSLHKGEKAAIVGNNGTGKTTLLKILAGHIKGFTGDLRINGTLHYVPQHYGHFNQLTVAAALGIAPLLEALQAIEQGATDQHYYDLLEHHWDIAARCEEAFARWGITGVDLHQPLQQLSGGMKTRLFLSGIDIFEPAIVLLDEPTNHLDAKARAQLYEWMENTSCTLLLTSHDRQLLRLCQPIWELQPSGISAYGGNYDFYAAQKEIEITAREHALAHHEKAWKEAKLKQQEVLERKQHADAQARRKGLQSGLPKAVINGRRTAAEASTGKLKHIHNDKVTELRNSLQEAAAMAQVQRIMKGYFNNPTLPRGKVLIQANDINFAYGNNPFLWAQPLTFTIRSGDRLAISGANGSGKSTLFHLLRGQLLPSQGSLQIAPCTTLLLDQDYSLIDRSKTVLEQAMAYNEAPLDPPIVHTLLANFLFMPDSWDRSCAVLSGGEMLRLVLCCMVLQNRTPDIIFLDEPVNNLDLSNIRMLAKIFAEYKGTLIIISHDKGFLQEAGIVEELPLQTVITKFH
ncbi:ABC transporter ATP-binding protein [Paraflavitalea soli]|uniref:ABC transporter ATP-binding protein n=1 Tax=Paraflavitalea soli TaxID=2315862 RepID=A0A3B7MV47_9BACT|nr:ABC-F family ATP-binding cassette domain-containing protein [Paraflavitalea soli]AXY78422.1 ABC transporter ATP-binding protein [Paraflavitalea soli]